MEQLLMTIFESVGDLVVLLQQTKLAITKEMPRVTLPVKSDISQPLPPAIQGRQ